MIKWKILSGFRSGGYRVTVKGASLSLVESANSYLALLDGGDDKAFAQADQVFAEILGELFEKEWEDIQDCPDWIKSSDDAIESVENLIPEKVEGDIVHIRTNVEYK